MKISTLLFLLGGLCPAVLWGQTNTALTYRVEASANASDGTYAPLWFTANRFGLSSEKPNSGYLRAGVAYRKELGRSWRLETGVDLAGATRQSADFVMQQLYADISWKMLTLSVGSKERYGFPLEKSHELSSGMMVEGPNARPVPQVRGEIKEYLAIPGTKDWLAFKGHIAYGAFTDGNWQENFTGANKNYAKKILYHSKSLMFRLGNKEKFPLEFEFGLLMATQFSGDQYQKQSDGSSKLITDMPDGLSAFWKAFFPQAGGSDTPEGEQVNVEGNMLGSWNFALSYYLNDWKFRAYLEHYFEDHSQMFWQYGRWKDGHIGIEITPPRNRWISQILWEGLCSKDATGPILYDGFWGSFEDVQMSGGDEYYNHYIYQAWQHWGYGMGNPLFPSPVYNQDRSITFKSNRNRANHLGIAGDPADEWKYRMLVSFSRYWGTYSAPLDKQRKQFSSLYEVTYQPEWAKGWSVSAALGLDRGNYLGNSTGGMVTLKKTGGFWK